MKMTLLVFCLLATTAAFGQYSGYISATPQPYHSPDHSAHASYSSMASEQSVVGGGAYTIGQGDRPASDFPQLAQIPLGDAARELKKQHEQVKKARVVWTNQ
jgi:hypothetical protein